MPTKTAKPPTPDAPLYWDCRRCPARLLSGVSVPDRAYCRACMGYRARLAALASRLNGAASGDPEYTCGLRRLADRKGY